MRCKLQPPEGKVWETNPENNKRPEERVLETQKTVKTIPDQILDNYLYHLEKEGFHNKEGQPVNKYDNEGNFIEPPTLQEYADENYTLEEMREQYSYETGQREKPAIEPTEQEEEQNA